MATTINFLCVLLIGSLLSIILLANPVIAASHKQHGHFDDDLIVVLSLAYVYLKNKFKKTRSPRLVWVNPYLKARRQAGRFARDVSSNLSNCSICSSLKSG